MQALSVNTAVTITHLFCKYQNLESLLFYSFTLTQYLLLLFAFNLNKKLHGAYIFFLPTIMCLFVSRISKDLG